MSATISGMCSVARGNVFGMLDAEGVEVFEEGALVLGGVVGDGGAWLRRRCG